MEIVLQNHIWLVKIGFLPQHSFLPSHKKIPHVIDLLIHDPQLKNLFLSDKRIDKRVYQLSAGELRYLEVGLLLHQPTDFILLDEPFTGIEPIYIQYITDMIESFKAQKGFMISDHNYRSLLTISSHIILMENGGCRQVQNKLELEQFYLPPGTFEEL